MNNRDYREFARQLRDAGKWHGSIERAVRLRNKRAENCTAKPQTVQQRLKTRSTLIPLGIRAAGFADGAARAEYPRRKNWDSPAASYEHTNTVREVNNGNYSSGCTYTHWTYEPQVQSYGVPLGARLHFHFNGRKYIITAPHGYRWDCDNDGVKLVSRANPADDYHPDSDELIQDGKPQPMRPLAAKLRDNAKTRRANAKRTRHEHASIKRAEREGCRVCVRDSVSAGNCRVGTETWARRHGLIPGEHYTPSEVLAKANGDASRVAVVVTVALRRHLREMTTGQCEVADHR